MLGKGGQGIVYLSERRGADNFTLPVALKFFSPERFPDERSYREAMERMAQVSSRVALIQHDNLLDVQNFIERRRIRVLEMEWVDGYDLDSLLAPGMLERAKARVGQKRWEYINNVIATAGPSHTRLKPGMAVAIIRECLAGLAALHREEIVHGDIKPSNIMVKRTGNAKIIDIGSALDLNDMPQQKTCTPQYAAPEMLDREEMTPRSDLASVGYVLIELLAGRPLFAEHPRLRNAAGEEADAAAVAAQGVAARSSAQRTVDDDLPAAHGARPDAAIRHGRAGRHGQRRLGRVPADTGPRRLGERIRERACAYGSRSWSDRAAMVDLTAARTAVSAWRPRRCFCASLIVVDCCRWPGCSWRHERSRISAASRPESAAGRPAGRPAFDDSGRDPRDITASCAPGDTAGATATPATTSAIATADRHRRDRQRSSQRRRRLRRTRSPPDSATPPATASQSTATAQRGRSRSGR